MFNSYPQDTRVRWRFLRESWNVIGGESSSTGASGRAASEEEGRGPGRGWGGGGGGSERGRQYGGACRGIVGDRQWQGWERACYDFLGRIYGMERKFYAIFI